MLGEVFLLRHLKTVIVIVQVLHMSKIKCNTHTVAKIKTVFFSLAVTVCMLLLTCHFNQYYPNWAYYDILHFKKCHHRATLADSRDNDTSLACC